MVIRVGVQRVLWNRGVERIREVSECCSGFWKWGGSSRGRIMSREEGFDCMRVEIWSPSVGEQRIEVLKRVQWLYIRRSEIEKIV